MSIIIAIDYGRKRTGIAATDTLQLIASGLTTVNTSELMTFLENYFKTESIERVIIGLPKQMNYTPSESAPLVLAFIEKFKLKFPLIDIETVDERFTSKMALQSMQNLKKKHRQNKGMIDEISATIMLQDYLLWRK
ncbi:MAG: Holliday junction resolvase RuvX [Flavobacteriaceae bacterium]|nr:Holliday junction resolvase RuvX [Flavobacteriaceae bacterium]MDZ4149329.1 Holliday junction resolvase RuvX [Flavobacteriaceae bacterium]